MRLWSIHPCYLDTAGLTACWREGLLARKVLAGETKGYRHHPQLIRFRKTADPLAAIDSYLGDIHEEAARRGYRFDKTKINPVPEQAKITVTQGQIAYESGHLLGKLAKRDPVRYEKALTVEALLPHPLFEVVPGEVEDWEILK